MADDKAGKGPDPKSLKEVNKELGFIEDALTSISVLLTSKIEEAFENIEDSTKKISEVYANNLEKSIKSMAKNSDAILKNTMAALSGELKVADVKKLQQKLRLQEEATERNIQKLKALGLIDDKKAEELQKDLTANIEHQNALLEEQLKIAKEQSPLIKDLVDGIKEKVKGLFSAAAMWKLIKDGVIAADKQVIGLSKSLGVSRDSASEMRGEMISYRNATADTFVSLERLYKAQQGLSEQLGIAVNFSNEERENFARLTELVGLTNEEAGGLAKNAAITGKSTKDYVADVRNAAFEAQRANKIRISDKELLSTISKLSSGILVKFKGNTDALAKAVVQAKKLGTTLEQVDKIGDSMLDFEQSIEKELEAELITGKQLNFERARAAALSGDQAELMGEIAAQAGSLQEFQSMNVVAQKSLAEAFGMSREEMADMLQKQETINKYGDAAAELNEEQVKEMEKRGMNAAQYTEMLQNQRDIQQQFADLMNRIQETLLNIIDGPLGNFIQGFFQVLEYTKLIYPIIGAIGGIIVGKMVGGMINYGKELIKAIPKLATMLGLSSGKAVAEMSAASALTLGFGMIGIIAGIAAGVSAISSETNKAKNEAQSIQDGMAPPGKGPFTITDSFGATAITAAGDGIAVSPNIKRSTGGGGGESMGMVVAAIKDLQSSISKLASRPITVSLDGEKVGTMVGRRNETGTEQVKNSYSLA